MKSERNAAIDILKAARDALIVSITDHVTPDLIDELPHRFNSGGDALLELGDRLWRLNNLISAMPADLPEPGIADPNLSYVVSPTLPTWNDFLGCIEANDTQKAAIFLTIMTGLDPEIAKHAVNVFEGQYALDPNFTGKANSLNAQLRCNAAGSLVLIKELFGVSGPTAVAVYEGLRFAS